MFAPFSKNVYDKYKQVSVYDKNKNVFAINISPISGGGGGRIAKYGLNLYLP